AEDRGHPAAIGLYPDRHSANRLWRQTDLFSVAVGGSLVGAGLVMPELFSIHQALTVLAPIPLAVYALAVVPIVRRVFVHLKWFPHFCLLLFLLLIQNGLVDHVNIFLQGGHTPLSKHPFVAGRVAALHDVFPAIRVMLKDVDSFPKRLQ